MRRSLAFCLVLAGLVGCARAPAPVPVSPSPPPSGSAGAMQVPRPGRLDLAAVAASIDPGQVAPIGPSLPVGIRAPLEKRLERLRDTRAQLRAARKRLTDIQKHNVWSITMLAPMGSDAADVQDEPMLVGLLEAFLLAEPIASGPDEAAADEARVLLVQLYAIANAAGEYGTALTDAFQSLLPDAMRGVQGQESRQVYEGVFSRAKALQRAVAARVLRAGSSDEGVALVLTELAAVEDRGDRYDRALAYREEAARRAGDKTSASDWLDLAEDYDRTLDATRGRAAAERAAGAPRPASMTPSDLADRSARVAALGRAAETVTSTADGAPFERRLARARALLALDRVDQGIADLEALRREAPRDARPVVGLVLASFLKAHLRIDLDLIRSAAHAIDDAASFEHREDEYFEDALGLSGALLFQEKVLLWAKDPPGQTSMLLAALKDLGDRARALRPFDPGRAGAVGYLASLVQDIVPYAGGADKAPILARVRRCAAESRDLLREFPDAIDVAKVALTCAYFEDDAELAVAQADSPPPRGAKDTTEMLHDRLAEHLVLTAREHEGDKAKGEAALEAAAAIAADADAAPGADHADIAALRGDAASLKAMWAGSAEAWTSAYRSYVAGLRAEGALRPRVLNNLAMTLFRQGQVAEAEARWEEAARDTSDDDKTAALNLAAAHAATASAADVDAAQAMFRDAAEGDDAKYQALAWLIALEKRKPKAKQSRASIVKWAKAAVSLESKSGSTKFRFASGEEGVRPKQSVQLSMGWSVRDGALGFPLRISLSPRLWLVLPAPVTFSEITALAR